MKDKNKTLTIGISSIIGGAAITTILPPKCKFIGRFITVCGSTIIAGLTMKYTAQKTIPTIEKIVGYISNG